MYPHIEPYEVKNLPVSSLHTLYYEVSGNKGGTPIVFLHGGPGGGTNPKDRAFFDPTKYKIVLFDQRGAGKSIPTASLEENTTWDLVKDIEKIREHLRIDKWHVFGGSWGSTLSLAYAQAHPDRVKSLVLRRVFTLRKRDDFLAPIPEAERHDLILAYHAQLNSVDGTTRLNAAKAWAKWEYVSSSMNYLTFVRCSPKINHLKAPIDPKQVAEADNVTFANAFARIANRYLVNGGFMRDGQLFVKSKRLTKFDTFQLRSFKDDMTLHVQRLQHTRSEVWPEIEFNIVPDAGHFSREPGIAKLLVQATDKFASL